MNRQREAVAVRGPFEIGDRRNGFGHAIAELDKRANPGRAQAGIARRKGPPPTALRELHLLLQVPLQGAQMCFPVHPTTIEHIEYRVNAIVRWLAYRSMEGEMVCPADTNTYVGRRICSDGNKIPA